jgi:tetratricopeptide (TPR) repeat protein
MSTKRPQDHHLTPEETLGFIEKSLSHKHLREVEGHLDVCLECVEYLATVTRSARPLTSEEEKTLGQIPARTPQELFDRLRPQIVASTPGPNRRSGSQRNWGKWLPAAAAATILFAALAWLQSNVIAPARGRQLAAKAMESLVTLRQATGRVPLRYIPEFQRARVTRSGFDTPHPAEASVEAQLRQAADLAPHAAETHLALGLFLLDTGALDEAEKQLETALAIEPDSILATNGLAVLQYERSIRNPSRATDFIRRGITLLRDAQRKSPENPQIVFNLAMFYQEAGSEEIAAAYWAAYLELDPDSEWGEVAAEKLDDLGR